MSEFKARFSTLVEIFEESTTRFATRPLFGTKTGGQWHWITYGEFRNDVEKMRAALARAGVVAGDRVAVISNNRVEWAVGAYATYTLGAAWVPMYEAQQEAEWAFILKDSGTKICLASTQGIAEKVRGLQTQIPSLEQVWSFEGPASDAHTWAALRSAEGAPAPIYRPSVSDIAGYIYTSGTTGNPKGVLLSHSNLAKNVSAALYSFPINAEDRSLSFLPWAHSFGQTAELHSMIGAGASMGICEGIPKILDNLAEVRPTILMAVPNIFNRIYDSVQKQIAGKPGVIQLLFRTALGARSKLREGQELSLPEKLALPVAQKLIFSKVVERFGGRLNYAISGGAALSREVAEFVDGIGITVYEGYGLTETSPVAAVNTPSGRRIGSVGKAIPGVTIKLDHEASGDEVEGEIVVYGHCVMQGYYNLPEETEKVFTEDGGFRTGDLGKFDQDGFLFITGRIKELYKLENGKYVAPAALEAKLELSPYIGRTMVFGANKAYNVAVVVPDFLTLEEWAKENGLDPSNRAQLVANEKVKALIREEIDKQSAGFKGYESIRKFHLGSEEFLVENDLLTPKLSMKRRNVVKRYQQQLDALYAG